jgi:hypothetical protein
MRQRTPQRLRARRHHDAAGVVDAMEPPAASVEPLEQTTR